MHTTTVRFDADVWALVAVHCGRLGISYGEFIRGAVLLRLGSLLLETHRAEEIDHKVATLATRAGRWKLKELKAASTVLDDPC